MNQPYKPMSQEESYGLPDFMRNPLGMPYIPGVHPRIDREPLDAMNPFSNIAYAVMDEVILELHKGQTKINRNGQITQKGCSGDDPIIAVIKILTGRS